MKKILNSRLFRRTFDILISPLTFLSAYWLKFVRTSNISSMPVSESIFMHAGVLPVVDHYYQPLINPRRHLRYPLDQPRELPGINWNVNSQLELLSKFNFQSELLTIPNEKSNAPQYSYYFNNDSFCPGDGEYLYNIIRHFKPRKIVEIGCGYSTMMAVLAEQKNATENASFSCSHICIEPYEMPWLEKINVQVFRKKVEEMDKDIFISLEKNDILFIDSSHIIRPQGDVLFEFLEILPLLKPGVIIHVHDIFSPKDYPKEWVIDKHSMWNEQYLLEAFLSHNSEFGIIGALNFLKNQHSDQFHRACPNSARTENDEPGSFWMIKN